MITKALKKERIAKALTTGVILMAIIGIVVWAIASKQKTKPTTAVEGKGASETTKEEYVEEMKDGSKLNTSEKLKKPKTLDGLEINNIQLKEIGGITTLLADVENKTGNEVKEKMVAIEVLDKNENVIVTVRGLIDSVEAGKKVQLNMSVTADISNAYDFRIKNN